MEGVGQRKNEAILPSSDASISIDFKVVKTTLIDLSLACSIGKSYGFARFGVVQEVFRAEPDPKMRFGSIAHKLMHYSE